MTAIQQRLFSMRDENYRSFQCALMPTVDPETVIGVRTPHIRRLAKQMAGSAEAEAFLKTLPHAYYEENNLHAFLIEQMKGYEETVEALERFLPYVNNWATCDSLSPKLLAKHRARLLPRVRAWMTSPHPYTVRFAIETLMRHYLTDAFDPSYPRVVAAVDREDYYVRMMVAWYFATALAIRYEEILPYLKERRLSPWIHGRTIQKAVESDRITAEQKRELRQLR